MKVALIIAGEIRLKELPCWRTINSLSPDVFISTWNKKGQRHSDIDKNLDISLRFMNNKYGKNIGTFFNRINNIKGKNIENIKPFNEIDHIDSSIIDYCGKYNSPIGTAYNIYHINKCLEIMRNYEIEHNFNYDIIIKIRPDIYIKEIFTETVYKSLLRKEIVFSSNTSSNIQKSDKYFIARRKEFIRFIDHLNDYKSFAWGMNIKDLKIYYQSIGLFESENLPLGERLFHQALLASKLDFLILNDNKTKLIRPKSRYINKFKKIYNNIFNLKTNK
tara:strand:+ start:2548 stop:3375 length:828 start_codon:yes stop_codon:yes gene_type:complete